MLDNNQRRDRLADPVFGLLTLWDYQQSIRKQVAPWDVYGQLIVAPTGSGKTCIGLSCCSDWMDANPTGRIVWTAMRRELLLQASVEAERMALDVSKFTFISLFTKNWAPHAGTPDCPVLLVLDEAHHAACDTAVFAKNNVAPLNILGMSATPARADHHALGFSRTILESNYESLIANGRLSQYEHYTIPGFTPHVVAKLFTRERERWGKSVLFFSTNAECKEFLDFLPDDMRERVGFVTTDGNRDSLIHRFKHNLGIDALVNVNILTEGYDEDSMDTVFIRRTDSNTVTTQAAGRVMRLFHGKVKKVVQPINSAMFYMTAKPKASFDYSCDGWMRTDVDPNAILDSFVDVSEFLINIEVNSSDMKALLGW